MFYTALVLSLLGWQLQKQSEQPAGLAAALRLPTWDSIVLGLFSCLLAMNVVSLLIKATKPARRRCSLQVSPFITVLL